MNAETKIAPATDVAAPPFQCAITADVVRRAMLLTSDNELRYYLSGVHVSPHPECGAYVVATDGRALVVFHDKAATCVGSAILAPSEATAAALKGQRGEVGARVVFASRDRIYVACASPDSAEAILSTPGPRVLAAQYERAVIDGTYPDWRKVFHAIDEAGTIPTLDGRLLSRLGKALSLDGRARQLLLRPTGSDPKTSPVWAFGDVDYGCGVIMGCTRPSHKPVAIPDWLGFTPPEAQTPDDQSGSEASDAATVEGRGPGKRSDLPDSKPDAETEAGS